MSVSKSFLRTTPLPSGWPLCVFSLQRWEKMSGRSRVQMLLLCIASKDFLITWSTSNSATPHSPGLLRLWSTVWVLSFICQYHFIWRCEHDSHKHEEPSNVWLSPSQALLPRSYLLLMAKIKPNQKPKNSLCSLIFICQVFVDRTAPLCLSSLGWGLCRTRLPSTLWHPSIL